MKAIDSHATDIYANAMASKPIFYTQRPILLIRAMHIYPSFNSFTASIG
jgi:hypothetical protein